MCIMCVEFIKQRMKVHEVARAYREMVIPEEHHDEVFKVIEENYDFSEVANELFKLAAEEDLK